ncbi:hypothetical protein GCM10010464_67760 [Pseudonocardia yunnanensis]|jgi:hypothetical protein|uniref:Transporter-associated domain-containing protein n=1 Tax=Pseudonocardia yunnanensis TaxID=58107 RepID=A0ABW4EYL8_9PSEU
MGVLGELFPGPKIRDEAGESGNGQEWELGPIDLDNRTVEVRRVEPAPQEVTPGPESED